MVDFAGINGGLELLQEEIDGGEVPALGDGDPGNWTGAMHAMQTAVEDGTQVDADALIDFAGLDGAIIALEQLIPLPNLVTFNGDPVEFGGDPVIFTP